jgi:hypothetical protein
MPEEPADRVRRRRGQVGYDQIARKVRALSPAIARASGLGVALSQASPAPLKPLWPRC